MNSILSQRLAVYEEILRKWQRTINLIAESTLDQIYQRHFLDSLQVAPYAPLARVWVDMGSGGGFPGLVTAMVLADVPGAVVHLIESNQRKCSFLREVSRETHAPAIVHAGRIEDVLPAITERVDAVSARALAPLSRLIQLSSDILLKGATGVFLKGQEVAKELSGYADDSRFGIEMFPSKTDHLARVVIVSAKL